MINNKIELAEIMNYVLAKLSMFKMQVLCHLAFKNYHLFLCINIE